MLKLKMMLCVMMLPLVVVSCTSKQSVSQCAIEATTASGVDNAASPTGELTLNGDIHPQREADHYAKNNWKERSMLMSGADRVAAIDGQLMQYCEQYTRASAEYKCLK